MGTAGLESLRLQSPFRAYKALWTAHPFQPRNETFQTTHKHTASVGVRAAVTEAKNAALDDAKMLKNRAYHYLCAALDGGTSDPLLASYGFEPR